MKCLSCKNGHLFIKGNEFECLDCGNKFIIVPKLWYKNAVDTINRINNKTKNFMKVN